MLAALYRTLAGAIILALLAPSAATASCLPGKMNYSDIDAVRFTRQGCNDLAPGAPTTMNCSHYWLFFSNFDPHPTYNQFDQSMGAGYYALPGSLADALAILRRHDFFNLVPRNVQVTDTTASAVSVRRCSIVTRLAALPVDGENPAVLALFNDFDAYATSATRTRVGNPLERFPYNIFDNWPND